MSNIKSQIESLLFIAGKPLAAKDIVRLVEEKISVKDAHAAVDELIKDYQDKNGGVRIIKSASEAQMVTGGDNAAVIQNFIKAETTAELTKPSIEALTIIAYRGPITKWELERIRGINCSLILRNLLIRGLIEEISEKRTVTYVVSMEFLQHMGYDRVDILPDYVALHEHALLSALMKQEG